MLLVGGEREANRLGGKQLVELVEVPADFLEKLIGGGTIRIVKHVVPHDFRGHNIEDEATEETVFGRGDEIEDLFWRA